MPYGDTMNHVLSVREKFRSNTLVQMNVSNSAATDFVVHDFVHRRRAYSGLCGSCVRTFSISCVLSVGAYRSIPAAGTRFLLYFDMVAGDVVYRSAPPASTLVKINWLGTQEKTMLPDKVRAALIPCDRL